MCGTIIKNLCISADKMDKLTFGLFNPFCAFHFYSEDRFSFSSLKNQKNEKKKTFLPLSIKVCEENKLLLCAFSSSKESGKEVRGEVRSGRKKENINLSNRFRYQKEERKINLMLIGA